MDVKLVFKRVYYIFKVEVFFFEFWELFFGFVWVDGEDIGKYVGVVVEIFGGRVYDDIDVVFEGFYQRGGGKGGVNGEIVFFFVGYFVVVSQVVSFVCGVKGCFDVNNIVFFEFGKVGIVFQFKLFEVVEFFYDVENVMVVVIIIVDSYMFGVEEDNYGVEGGKIGCIIE